MDPKTKKNFKNNRRRGNKPTSKTQKYEKDAISSNRSKDNDPSWYLVNGQLAKDVASFSFNNATGDRMTFSPQAFGGSMLPNAYFRMPGIASVLTGPTIGVSVDGTSPINIAAKDIYSFVRHANSGHSNYDPNDLMTYLMAMDSIQTFWSYLVRVYGVTQTFQQRNRYIGDALLNAMGVMAYDVRTKIAELRAYINQFAIQASVLAVPNTMSYYLRHAWMYQNVYCDEDNAKAQLFMYVPAYLYKYAIMDNGAGGLEAKLLTVSENTTGRISDGMLALTVSQLIAYGDELLGAVLSQEDVGIMSGDILKAYGSDKLYRFNQIDENYAIAPTYSEEVLAQFHNTTLAGRRIAYLDTSGGGSGVYRLSASRALSVLQNNEVGKGWLEFSPAFCNAAELNYTQILDLWTQDVSPELALVASRNKMVTNKSPLLVVSKAGETLSSLTAFPVQAVGSEIVIDIDIYVYDDTSGSLIAYDVCPRDTTGYNTGVVSFTTKFNQFPLLRGCATANSAVSFPVGEISNYALLNYQDIAPMHKAALLSMFGVPYRW